MRADPDSGDQVDREEEEAIDRVKAREYECFIEDHEPKRWTAGRCAGYAGRSLHLMRCKRNSGHGLGGLFCKQHAKDPIV